MIYMKNMYNICVMIIHTWFINNKFIIIDGIYDSLNGTLGSKVISKDLCEIFIIQNDPANGGRWCQTLRNSIFRLLFIQIMSVKNNTLRCSLIVATTKSFLVEWELFINTTTWFSKMLERYGLRTEVFIFSLFFIPIML